MTNTPIYTGRAVSTPKIHVIFRQNIKIVRLSGVTAIWYTFEQMRSNAWQ